MRISSVPFLLAALVCLMPRVWAMGPGFITDAEFAQFPIIVVARWTGVNFKGHLRHEANSITAMEFFTDLEILRVLKGDVSTGTNQIKLGWGIVWEDDGHYLSSGTSSYFRGEVADVTQPNLWFLQRSTSWDNHNPTNYLSISHYRAIQPLVLEPFFQSLNSAQPEILAPQLLHSSEPLVVQRVLRYVCGETIPSLDPDDSSFYTGPARPGKLLVEQAEAVRGLLGQTTHQELRATAAVVYSRLAGAAGNSVLRQLLQDPDPGVRTAAVVLLARQRDEPSLPWFTAAVAGIRNGDDARNLVRALADWGDVRLVPALISFLRRENVETGYEYDFFNAALLAQKSLTLITGHQFPNEVESSRRAWESVTGISDRAARKRALDRLQTDDPFPLEAEVVGDGTTNAAIRLTNHSKREVIVTRKPDRIEQSWIRSLAYWFEYPGGSDTGFVVLTTGASMQFPVELSPKYLRAEVDNRKLTLVFVNNGSRSNLHAWFGFVEAHFGKHWTEAGYEAKPGSEQ